jgi:heat shock protein HspQ
MKALVLTFSVLVLILVSCCGNPCPNAEPHKYNIGDIVHHRLNHNKKFIIADTIRDSECQPWYYLEDSEGEWNSYNETSITK